jgi:hypothetical protein
MNFLVQLNGQAGRNGAHAEAEVESPPDDGWVPPTNEERAPRGSEPDLLAGLRNGAWLDKQEFPPLAYALPGVIPEGSVLLVGPPKIGKSWFVLALALACASGGWALGNEVERRPVLYLALEDGDRRLQDRCRKLLHGDPIPRGFEYLTLVKHGRVLETIAAWMGRQHDAPPLVILDTLGKVMPSALPGDSAYQRDYRIGGELKQLAEEHAGMTLLTNHHDHKAASEDFVDSVSGTHGLAGAADAIMVLARARHEENGLLKVTGRDVPEGEYAVTFTEGGLWSLDGPDLAVAAQRARDARVTAGLGDRSTEIIGYVLQHPQGVTSAQVATEFDMDPRAAGTYLGRMADAGRLMKPRRGVYTPVVTVESVESSDGEGPEVNAFNGFHAPTGGDYDPDDPARFTR